MRQKRWGKVKGKVTENCLMGSPFLLQPTHVRDHRTSCDSSSIQAYRKDNRYSYERWHNRPASLAL